MMPNAQVDLRGPRRCAARAGALTLLALLSIGAAAHAQTFTPTVFTPGTFTPTVFTPGTFTPIKTFTPFRTFTPIQTFTPLHTLTPIETFTPMGSATPAPTATAAAGSLDPSFGNGGIVTTLVGSESFANALALQRDGKIVAAGYSNTGSTEPFVLARYNPDGSLDTSFGSGGTVTTTFVDSTSVAFAVAQQPDGKIVAAGSANTGGTERFALARYNPDGSLDASFGDGGTVTTVMGFYAVAFAMVLQPDGEIVAAGESDNASANAFALARYNPDGSLDASFGSGGTVTTIIGSEAFARAVVLQPDGKIVAAGESNTGGTEPFALVRYNPDGSVDMSFGSGGTTSVATGGALAVALQPDGKIVAAGDANATFAVARFNPDGTNDTGFGSGGTVTTFVGPIVSVGRSVALQSDGKIIAAGDAKTGVGEAFGFALARYNPDGSLDTSFGSGGTVTTVIGSFSIGNAVAQQPDGKIVVAGYSNTGSTNAFALARYLSGAIPTSIETATPIQTFTPIRSFSPTRTATTTNTSTSLTPTTTATGTATATVSATATLSPTSTWTASPTPTPTLSRTATPTLTATSTPTPCGGDCDQSGSVTVDELVKGVGIALGSLPLSTCSAFDLNHDGSVTVQELIAAVSNALYGCGYTPPTPLSTHTPTETPAATSTATRTASWTPSETATATDTPTPTASLTATQTSTPTATPRIVQINIGSGRGLPGGTTTVTVSLITAGVGVAGTENYVSFEADLLDLNPTDCIVNPAIKKTLVASIVEQDPFNKTLRLDIGSNQNRDLIPDGPLYTCTFHISPSAPLGFIPLSNGNMLAFGPDGSAVDNVIGADGSVTVSLVP